MKDICSNAVANTFFRSVEPRFESFKEKMKKLASKSKLTFSEDVFMDTIVRCMNTFQTENATDLDVDNYFWRAFKQNSFSNFSRNKFRDMVNLDSFGGNLIDEEYNTDIDEIVDLIKTEVRNEFGEIIYNAWILHVCNGYTYTELEECGYGGLNLHNEFRQIKRYITNQFIKHNNKLRTLLTENNFI